MKLNETQNLISFVEDRSVHIDENWFYHGTNFKKELFTAILEEGIKAPYLRSNNSNYRYIFVSKKNNNKYGAFHNYSIYPRFILSPEIQAISKNDSLIRTILKKGYHHLSFTSLYPDEYQVYKRITRNQILGIAYDLYYLLKQYPSDAKETLDTLHILSELLTSKELPLIDVSTSREINKSKVLSLKIK